MRKKRKTPSTLMSRSRKMPGVQAGVVRRVAVPSVVVLGSGELCTGVLLEMEQLE